MLGSNQNFECWEVTRLTVDDSANEGARLLKHFFAAALLFAAAALPAAALPACVQLLLRSEHVVSSSNADVRRTETTDPTLFQGKKRSQIQARDPFFLVLSDVAYEL